METEKKYGSITLEKYEPQLWTCLNCYCGLCIESCPAYRELKNYAVAARGLSQIALGLLWGEINLSELSDEIVYSCTECRWCEYDCSQNTLPIIVREGTRRTKVSGATVIEILRSIKVEKGDIPPEVRDVLNKMVKCGNPYGGSKVIKDKWSAGLGMKNSKDTILYVGSLVPYEHRSTRMAEAIVDVLKETQQDFTVLGSEEMDSGAFTRMMGEEGLFNEMVAHNLKNFEDHGIKQVICVSPHDYDAFVNYYDDMNDIEVKHYTEVLWEMIDTGRIKFSRKLGQRVTYHDPCYLGRRNKVYDEPRKILQSIPGLELIELKLTKETAYCCGGGGTGLFLDLPRVNMNLTRVDQVRKSGTESVAVACPICLQMLDDAMKSRDYEMEVKDVAQLMKEAI